MRFLARVIGLLLLAGAFAAALIDGARWIADGSWTPTSTGAALYWLSPRSLSALQGFVETRVGGWAWDMTVRALMTPAFLSLLVVSAALYVLGRPRPLEIGRSSRDR